MATRGALYVDAIPGQRWDLALDLLREAGPLFVLDGDVAVALQRYAGWPSADGRIHLQVLTGVEPDQITQNAAQRDVDLGLASVRASEIADSRLGELFREYGVVYEYVQDYGHGGRPGWAHLGGRDRIPRLPEFSGMFPELSSLARYQGLLAM